MPRQGEKHGQDKENAGFDTAQLMIRFSLQPQHTNTRPLHRWEGGAWGPVNTEFYQCVTITETPALNNFERWSTVKSQCSVALKISHFLPAEGWSCSWAVVVQNFLNVFLSSPLGCLSHRCTVPKLPPSFSAFFLFISPLVQWKTLGLEWYEHMIKQHHCFIWKDKICTLEIQGQSLHSGKVSTDDSGLCLMKTRKGVVKTALAYLRSWVSWSA